MLDTTTLLTIAVASVLFGGLLLLGLRETKKETQRDRMSQVFSGGQAMMPLKRGGSAPVAQSGNYEKRLRQLEKQHRDAAEEERRSLEEKIAEAGWRMPKHGFYIMGGVLGLVSMGVMLLLKMPIFVLILGIPGGFLGLPHMVLNIARKRRRNAFLKDLADALEAITRGIKAGLPVSEAMAMIGRDFEGPVAEEFMRAVDEQKLGLSVGETLERVARRVPLAEMRMMAMAVAIQSKTGGSLAETLTNLADVIRGRERLRRKVKAVSSEAKISALIMGCLPVCVIGGLYGVNPEYVLVLFEDRGGQMLMIGCGIWMSIGVFIMSQMVNFKV